ncbi:MAG: hypothetical protein ACI37T_08965 [Candidatus Gastranaerophilaceae bacterium]
MGEKMAKEKRKKIFFGTLFNIFIAAELVVMLNVTYMQYTNNHKLAIPYLSRSVLPFEVLYKNAFNNESCPFGQNAGENFKTAPIIIFGDSCAYGLFLNKEDNFSGQLSQFLKRPVYNRAWWGWSVQQTYYFLMNEDFYKEYKQEPKAVIFVYTPDIFEKMYAPELSAGLRYTVMGDNIIRNSMIYNWLNFSYLFEKIFTVYGVIRSKFFDSAFNDFKLYLVKGKQNADKHWKNTSFYIIKITDIFDEDNPEKWKELEKEGFKIIEGKDLMGDNYTKKLKYWKNKDDDHPTRLFWEDFIPKFVSKTDL